MPRHSLAHLSDGTLRRQLASLVATDCTTAASLLSHLAEFDARRLYAEDGYPSMFTYCVQRLRFSEDMAFKRIRVARAARRFPAILEAIAASRLHLTGAVLLSPHLKSENAEELLAASIHKTRVEIELMLAQRFPRPDVPTLVRAIPATSATFTSAGEVVQEPEVRPPVSAGAAEGPPSVPSVSTPSSGREVVPEPVPVPLPPTRVAPLAPQRFALQVTIGQHTHDKLRRLQDLLGHALPSGDVSEVLDRAFDALLEKLEKAKRAAPGRPRRRPSPSSTNPRHVPAQVRREVWERDGGRCTFVSEAGRRCLARKFLEYDHVLEVARGGRASVGGIRLRCRAHNQFTAERTFGLEFMRARREESSPRTEDDAGGPRSRIVAHEGL